MKKLTAFFLVLILICTALPTFAKERTISNLSEWEAFTEEVNEGRFSGEVLLTTDLDFTGREYTPIGTKEHPFRGTFLGGGHTLSGISFEDETLDGAGVFGYAKSATISDLFLEDSSIRAYNQTGGFLGYGKDVTLLRLSNSARVKGRRYTGGILGMGEGSVTISMCENLEETIGYNSVGGIAGAIFSGGTSSVTDCRNTAQISGGNMNLGGIIGEAFASGTFKIERVVSVGSIKRGGDGYHCGAVVGLLYGERQDSVCTLDIAYSLEGTKGLGHLGSYASSGKVEERTLMMLSTPMGMEGFSFPNVWYIGKDNLPHLTEIDRLKEISIFVDGEYIPTNPKAHIKNDRTYLPMRALFEALGAEVSWDADARQAIAVRNGKTVVFTIDSPVAHLDGEEITFDTAPYIEDGRTFIPVRAAAETLGAKVEWKEHPRRVEIVLEK